MIDLTGRVVLVTGAGGGIGGGIVRRFVATGATVVAHTRHSPTDHLRYPDGSPVATVYADLATADGPRHVIDEALVLQGRLDGLVNNAGAQPIARFDTLSDEQFTDMMDINVTATHRLTQLAAAAMRRNADPGRRLDRPHRLHRGAPPDRHARPLRHLESRPRHARPGGCTHVWA